MPRRPPHFKVFCSLANHRKTTELWENHDLLAIWLKLGVLAIERFADKTGDRFKLTTSDAKRVTMRSRADHAWKALGRVAEQSNIEVDKPLANKSSGVVRFPNFEQKQFSREKNGTEKAYSPSSSSTSTSIERKGRRSSSSLPPELAWELAQKEAKKHGASWGRLTPSRAQSVQARMKEYPELGVDVIAHGISGYVSLRKSNGFDWLRWLTPSTILRPKTFSDYIDAYGMAQRRKPLPEAQHQELPENLREQLEANRGAL